MLAKIYDSPSARFAECEMFLSFLFSNLLHFIEGIKVLIMRMQVIN